MKLIGSVISVCLFIGLLGFAILGCQNPTGETKNEKQKNRNMLSAYHLFLQMVQ